MAPRLSGQTSLFGVVCFVSKPPLGIERQKKLEKFAILTRKPRSHARILIYRTWPITQVLFLNSKNGCIFFDRRDLSFIFTHRHNFEIQNALVSKQRTLLSWKVVNKYKFSTFYAPVNVNPDPPPPSHPGIWSSLSPQYVGDSRVLSLLS